MAIGVFIYPEEMSSAQYDQMMSRLEAAGQAAPSGRQHHFAFGTDDSVMVVDVWDSEDDFAAFAEVLGPILDELDVEVETGLLELRKHIS